MNSVSTFCSYRYRFNSNQEVIIHDKNIYRLIHVFLNSGIGTSIVLITRELLTEKKIFLKTNYRFM